VTRVEFEKDTPAARPVRKGVGLGFRETAALPAGGTCSTSSNIASLSIDSATFDAGVTNAGVTIAGASAIKGLTVSQVTALSFAFTGHTNVGGDPRFNIPVTRTGQACTVFIAGNACYSGTGPYTVDAFNNPSCAVQSPNGYYPNWAG
jgi:hypothetical protein